MPTTLLKKVVIVKPEGQNMVTFLSRTPAAPLHTRANSLTVTVTQYEKNNRMPFLGMIVFVESIQCYIVLSSNTTVKRFADFPMLSQKQV